MNSPTGSIDVANLTFIACGPGDINITFGLWGDLELSLTDTYNEVLYWLSFIRNFVKDIPARASLD